MPELCDAHLLPGRQEATVCRGADGLDLRSQRGQRPPSQDLEHIGVAPLVASAGGSRQYRRSGVGELTSNQPAVDGEPAEHVAGDPQPEAEAGRGVVRGERAVRAGIAAAVARRADRQLIR